jgi:hypothetical protein
MRRQKNVREGGERIRVTNKKIKRGYKEEQKIKERRRKGKEG